MELKKQEIQHIDKDKPVVSSRNVGGASQGFANLAELFAVPIAKRGLINALIRCYDKNNLTSTTHKPKTVEFVGIDTTDNVWIDVDSWKIVGELPVFSPNQNIESDSNGNFVGVDKGKYKIIPVATWAEFQLAVMELGALGAGVIVFSENITMTSNFSGDFSGMTIDFNFKKLVLDGFVLTHSSNGDRQTVFFKNGTISSGVSNPTTNQKIMDIVGTLPVMLLFQNVWFSSIVSSNSTSDHPVFNCIKTRGSLRIEFDKVGVSTTTYNDLTDQPLIIKLENQLDAFKMVGFSNRYYPEDQANVCRTVAVVGVTPDWGDEVSFVNDASWKLLTLADSIVMSEYIIGLQEIPEPVTQTLPKADLREYRSSDIDFVKGQTVYDVSTEAELRSLIQQRGGSSYDSLAIRFVNGIYLTKSLTIGVDKLTLLGLSDDCYFLSFSQNLSFSGRQFFIDTLSFGGTNINFTRSDTSVSVWFNRVSFNASPSVEFNFNYVGSLMSWIRFWNVDSIGFVNFNYPDGNTNPITVYLRSLGGYSFKTYKSELIKLKTDGIVDIHTDGTGVLGLASGSTGVVTEILERSSSIVHSAYEHAETTNDMVLLGANPNGGDLVKKTIKTHDWENHPTFSFVLAGRGETVQTQESAQMFVIPDHLSGYIVDKVFIGSLGSFDGTTIINVAQQWYSDVTVMSEDIAIDASKKTVVNTTNTNVTKEGYILYINCSVLGTAESVLVTVTLRRP